jgi:hypothetical protein
VKVRSFNFIFLGVATSFFVAMGDVMVLEKMKLHNPIRGYDTFVFSKLHYFLPYKHGLRDGLTKDGILQKQKQNSVLFLFLQND